MKTDYEAERLAQPKGQLSSWPSVYALDLTDTWPNSFSIPTASMTLSQFIVHADAAELKNPGKALAIVVELEGFGTKSLNKDGHLITEDSVLPTTAPGGAPERNRCYQTPATLLILPLAPAAFARSARLAPLTSLRPRWGLALFEWLRLQ